MTTFDERVKARQAAAERNAKPRTGIAASMFAGGTENSDEAVKLMAAAMMVTCDESDGQISPADEEEGE